MKRNIILTSVVLGAALTISQALSGQNLNPTVEVDRTYEGKPVGLLKEDVPMQVPDSLTSLKLDFDYSVFDNPYKGSYEFRPYLVIMKPDDGPAAANQLYARLGAGYSLHPDAEVVFTPRMSGPFHLSVYFNHGSYFGNYRNVWPSVSDNVYTLKAGKVSPTGNLNGILPTSNASMPDTHKGHDMLNRAGISGGYDFRNSTLSFGVGYYGIGTKDTLVSRNFHAFDLGARLKSNEHDTGKFSYDAGFSFRLFSDGFDSRHYGTLLADPLGGNELSLDATVGSEILDGHRILVDLDAQVATYKKAFKSNAGLLAVTPKYVLSGNRWRADLGVRLETFMGGDDRPEESLKNHQQGSQIIYPAVSAVYEAVPGVLNIYGKVDGKGDINSYSSVLAGNHWFDPSFGHSYGPLLDNSVERINARLGVRGSVKSTLSFDLSAGYSVIGNGLLDAVDLVNTLPFPVLLGGVAYKDYGMFSFKASALWRSEGYEFGGDLLLRATDLDAASTPNVFEPAALKANLHFAYDWNGRLLFGARADISSARKGGAKAFTDGEFKIPGFVDLGVFMRYRYSRKLSFWIAGGNLLGANIQRHPLYTESGVNATAGIALNL